MRGSKWCNSYTFVDEDSSALEKKIFYPAGITVMAILVVTSWIRSAVKDMRDSKSNLSSEV